MSSYPHLVCFASPGARDCIATYETLSVGPADFSGDTSGVSYVSREEFSVQTEGYIPEEPNFTSFVESVQDAPFSGLFDTVGNDQACSPLGGFSLVELESQSQVDQHLSTNFVTDTRPSAPVHAQSTSSTMYYPFDQSTMTYSRTEDCGSAVHNYLSAPVRQPSEVYAIQVYGNYPVSNDFGSDGSASTYTMVYDKDATTSQVCQTEACVMHTVPDPQPSLSHSVAYRVNPPHPEPNSTHMAMAVYPHALATDAHASYSYPSGNATAANLPPEAIIQYHTNYFPSNHFEADHGGNKYFNSCWVSEFHTNYSTETPHFPLMQESCWSDAVCVVNATEDHHVRPTGTAYCAGNRLMTESFFVSNNEDPPDVNQTSYVLPNVDLESDVLPQQAAEHNHSSRNPLACPHCTRVFNRPSHLEIHMRIHSGQQPYECVLCGRCFAQSSNLQRHLSSHKSLPPLNRPPQEQVSTLDPENDRLAISVHRKANLKSWSCRVCHISLANYGQLRLHMIRHRADRVFACVFEACSDTFDSSTALLAHLTERHRTTISPVGTRCRTCGLSFPDFKKLVQHWLPRRRGLPPRCAVTKRSQRFNSIHGSGHSAAHLKLQTRIRLLGLRKATSRRPFRSYRCPICPRRSLALSRLRHHLTKAHGELLASVTEGHSTADKQTTVNKREVTGRLSDHPPVKNLSVQKSSTGKSRSSKTMLFLLQVDEEPRSVKRRISKFGSRSKDSGRGILSCQYCGRNFQKPKFHSDHELMCKQTSVINGTTVPLVSARVGQALTFELLAECSTSRARRCQLWLPHCPAGPVQTPVFMPVGTQGAMKGITVAQLEQLDCRILLGNTYHLGHRPGPEIIEAAGGLHKFMAWPRAILTDSGGFQMVSLNDLSSVTEEGVHFTSPHNSTEMLLTPEESVGHLQHTLGSDIVMQLDHVVHVLTESHQMEQAMHRSIRWLDRAIEAHEPHKSTQNLFAITQGGLDPGLREKCIEEMLKRKEQVAGFAIGGLSGGEAKEAFWRTVSLSTSKLPRDRPRYLMGVGFPMDLVVCVALGCDMFDCVYPTRTGRFGHALVPWGQLNLRHALYKADFRPIDEDCPCPHCTRPISRAFIHASLSGRQVAASAIISLHNLSYMLNLMRQMREAISANTFPQFVRDFFQRRCYCPTGTNQSKAEFEGRQPPAWAVEALASVGIDISDIGQDPESSDSDYKELKRTKHEET